MLDIKEEIQILLLRQGLSMRKLARKMREAGYDIPAESGLSYAFNQKRIRFQTVQEIVDFLGYELVLRKK